MSTLTETSLADMKAGFPQAPKPIQVILTLQSLHPPIPDWTSFTSLSLHANTEISSICNYEPALLCSSSRGACFLDCRSILSRICTFFAHCAGCAQLHSMHKQKRASFCQSNACNWQENTWTPSPWDPPLPTFSLKPCHCRCTPPSNSGAFASQTFFSSICLCGLLTTTVRQWQKIPKQTVNAWQPTGIPPTALTHLSSASSPAWHSQDAPTSRWPTTTLATLASV